MTTTADGVSSKLVQPAIYRGAVTPTSADIGDLWEDTSTNPPVLKQCTTAPNTFAAVSTGGGSGTVTSVNASGGTGITVTGGPITTSGSLTITNTAPDQTVAFINGTGISVTGTYPNFTVTNTSPSSGGTVTSVAALTLGTTGSDLSSTVANGTTTPVITLNVPTASATNRGALSSADWTTFNNKGSGTVTSVNGTGTVNGLTLTGTVTSSGNLTLGGTLDLSSPPAIGGTSPAAGTFTTLSLTGTSNQVSSVAVSSDPAAPSAGNLKTFARTIAGGYTAPAFLNATNAVVQLQPAWANKRIGTASFAPNSTTITIQSLATFTGTAVSVTPGTTTLYARAARVAFQSTSTAGTFANYYQGASGISFYTLGVTGTPNYGGFYYVIKFGIGDTVASPRTFVGLASSTATPTNVEPSTLTNVIGVGQGAANTNLFLYYGGSAAQTPIDLGANFPTNTSSTDWYELTLFAPPTSNNTVYYQVIRLNTGNVASGTLTGTAGTVLPANTTTLAIRNWRTNNATAAAVTLHIGSIYVETDY